MAKPKLGPAFDDATLDALIGDTKTPAQLSALFRWMQQRIAERMLAGELTEHLGYATGRSRRSWCRRAWQQRPLDRRYPVVIFDALRVKIRDEGVVRNKAVDLALGVDREGHKDVLGLWIEQTEGAGFWLRVMTELKRRGVDDILVALVDGLVGFPDASTTVFPQAQVDHCVVHLVRQSLAYASWKERKKLASAFRTIYRAPTESAAAAALAELGIQSSRLRVPAGNSPAPLHHQRDREPAHATAQNHQIARPHSDRRDPRDPTALYWVSAEIA